MKSILRSSFDEWETVISASDLSQDLKKYRYALSIELYRYLESLLESGSVLNDKEFYSACYGISREEISRLKIYKDIAIYNIYHQALDIFEKNRKNYPIEIGGNNRGFEGIEVEGTIDNQVFPIYKYHYGMDLVDNPFERVKVPSGCEAVKIGDVNIFTSTIENEVDKDVLDSYISKLQYLSCEKCPYPDSSLASSKWKAQQRLKIESYEDKIRYIFNYGKLLKNNQKIVEIQNYFANLILKSYGLESEGSFSEIQRDGNKLILAKKYPNAKVYKNIQNL